ncbi:4-hydroxy-2-oxoheptanedioate aldolase [Noviherbaspirillum galbum]|uniref:4-hydroxy-2-oxoheptanedioate aldolase n=1 Tax=Noviherbaspirillum galbum TaxID=2709383 RepID=A0A6B3SMP7_9BURK|nr:4-hydroxy-2-oxoheptanedioate aldolase [Noviherbaspirillum galbum]NEX59986.1 4-hydroxy-2-oxoheptanedioate aldolase [Noviherbaspirillum galbum]
MNNGFKEALRNGKAQIGLWLSLASPYTAEVCATAGFDWLLVDGEHAPNDVPRILAQLQALAAYPSHHVVRAVDGNPALIKQLLDIGAQTLLIPMVDTAEQARRLVHATRYAPEGSRGEGAAVGRASLWGLRRGYVDHANDNVCLLVQAESRTALQNLEEICAVDGVDGVFIGPADLSASLGHRGQPGHPEVQAAIDDAVARIVRTGKAAGILTSDPLQARRYLDMGCLFVATGVDVSLLARAARELMRGFRAGADAEAALPRQDGGSVY